MNSHSIHPRVEAGTKKKNTCAPRANRNGGQGGKSLRRATKRLNARVNAWNSLDERSKLSYRKPGSMKP